MAWSDPFDDPVTTPEGRLLATLREAGHYIAGLPAKVSRQPHWQIAVEMVITVAEGKGPVMVADIAMRRALNHGRPAPAKQPRRKGARR